MSKFNARKNNADTVKFSREEKEALKRLAGYDADDWFNGIASAIIWCSVLFFVVCIFIIGKDTIKSFVAKHDTDKFFTVQESPIQEKPKLYITAVMPDILQNNGGVKVLILDEALDEQNFSFSGEHEAARFLEDISEKFTVIDYTKKLKLDGSSFPMGKGRQSF